jgi:hypothetical protein
MCPVCPGDVRAPLKIKVPGLRKVPFTGPGIQIEGSYFKKALHEPNV